MRWCRRWAANVSKQNMPDLQARLDLPPKDAVKFFRSKQFRISWNWFDVWRDINAEAFTVAKATSYDVLRAIRTEVDTAIGDGMTFQEFKKKLRPRLQDLGWWGKQEVLDADTGEVTQAQLGSDRRLRTIFQANVQTSYMAGRNARQVENAKDRPWWRYVAVMDGRTRPHHAELNGRVWRFDDPIWDIIYPANGWGCRCRVVALSDADMERMGLKPERGTVVVEREVPLGSDGEMTTVKGLSIRGIGDRNILFYPDPGWDYNPGKASAAHLQDVLERKRQQEATRGAP